MGRRGCQWVSIVLRSPSQLGTYTSWYYIVSNGLYVQILMVTHSISVDLQLDRVVDSVQGNGMEQRSNGTVGVLPVMIVSQSRHDIRRVTYQLAEVARGIRWSSGMTDSSKFFLLKTPGFS